MSQKCIRLCLFAAAVLSAEASIITTVPVSTQGTFFRQSVNDTCLFAPAGCNMQPAVVDLAAVGLTPGDLITLTPAGELCVSPFIPCHAASIGGIFSSSSVINAPGFQQRVPGALDAGLPNIISVALNTFFGDLDTTVAQDFYVFAGTQVVIPVGAAFLDFGTLDSFYADNSGWQTVSIDLTRATATPEPGSVWLVAWGMCGLGFICRAYRTLRDLDRRVKLGVLFVVCFASSIATGTLARCAYGVGFWECL